MVLYSVDLMMKMVEWFRIKKSNIGILQYCHAYKYIGIRANLLKILLNKFVIFKYS